MKSTVFLLLLCSVMLFACGPTHIVVQTQTVEAPPPAAPEVSYQSFYDDLAPYGSWIDYPGYGYVWRPDVGPEFKPYSTNGDWVYTDAGWAWASDYDWGWAAFHYGRWFYEGGYGWMWIPGNEWAPAWVSWRRNDDFYGWAPLGPNVSVNMALNSYSPPVNYWNFVPRTYMGRPQARNNYVNESRNVTIINNTTIINNNTTIINNAPGSNRQRGSYAPGPDPAEVGRVTGNTLRPVPLREANTPAGRVSNGQFNIYRPQVNAAPANQPNNNIRPARVQAFRDVRPAAQNPPERTPQGNAGNQPATNNNPQPVNPRPATQNQGYDNNGNYNNGGSNQNNNNHDNSNPNNNNLNQPVRQPSNPNRPVQKPSTINLPVNNSNINPQPVNSSQPPPNEHPAVQNPGYNHPTVNPAPVQPAPATLQPAGNNSNNRLLESHYNQRASNNQTNQVPQPSPVNRPLNNRPVTPKPAPANQPVHPVTPPANNKPANTPDKPKEDKPKDRKTDG